MIRLQTAQRRDIPNNQLSEISAFERNYAAALATRFADVRFVGPVSGQYNCHGLTFASRRTRIVDLVLLPDILSDDGFKEIAVSDSEAGDVVVYFSDEGEATHSGIVLDNTHGLRVPRVWSKWGSGPEAVHLLYDVPSVYGTTYKAYRYSP